MDGIYRTEGDAMAAGSAIVDNSTYNAFKVVRGSGGQLLPSQGRFEAKKFYQKGNVFYEKSFYRRQRLHRGGMNVMGMMRSIGGA